MQVASEPLTFEKGKSIEASLAGHSMVADGIHSGLDGDSDEPYGGYNTEDEPASDPDRGQVLRAPVGPCGS